MPWRLIGSPHLQWFVLHIACYVYDLDVACDLLAYGLIDYARCNLQTMFVTTDVVHVPAHDVPSHSFPSDLRGTQF